jgi:fumarate hydratase class II
MSYEAWIMIFGIALANLFTLTGGLVHIAGRLTRIETDIKWIKAGCKECPQNLEKNSQ